MGPLSVSLSSRKDKASLATALHLGSNCWAICWNIEEGVCSSIQLMKMDLNFPENWMTKKWQKNFSSRLTNDILFNDNTLTFLQFDRMCVTHAVFPVPGLPDMYMLPGLLISMRGLMKFSITANSLSLQKILLGVEVWRAWRALAKLVTV